MPESERRGRGSSSSSGSGSSSGEGARPAAVPARAVLVNDWWVWTPSGGRDSVGVPAGSAEAGVEPVLLARWPRAVPVREAAAWRNRLPVPQLPWWLRLLPSWAWLERSVLWHGVPARTWRIYRRLERARVAGAGAGAGRDGFRALNHIRLEEGELHDPFKRAT